MDWYIVLASLAAIYIPSALVVWWIFTTSSGYDPYDADTQRSLKKEKERDYYDDHYMH